jgi:hypothetical protein
MLQLWYHSQLGRLQWLPTSATAPSSSRGEEQRKTTMQATEQRRRLRPSRSGVPSAAAVQPQPARGRSRQFGRS